jgi:predicted N-acetyltransferase YhbS
MIQQDIAAVLQIQTECYPIGINESEQAIRRRLDVSPDSSWVVTDAHGALGYLVAYRSSLGKITPLGGAFDIPTAPTALYLHDLAICTRDKGTDLGATLVETAWRMARTEGLRYSSLVSVQNSLGYWSKLGYEVCDDLHTAQIDALMTYETESFYMVKQL